MIQADKQISPFAEYVVKLCIFLGLLIIVTCPILSFLVRGTQALGAGFALLTLAYLIFKFTSRGDKGRWSAIEMLLTAIMLFVLGSLFWDVNGPGSYMQGH